MSNTGSIHDIADTTDRIISGPGKYAVIKASYYGGKGYTTHLTADATVRQARKLVDYSTKIIDETGQHYDVQGDQLIKT